MNRRSAWTGDGAGHVFRGGVTVLDGSRARTEDPDLRGGTQVQINFCIFM